MVEGTARLALATCAELPELDDETRGLRRALAARGISAAPTIWSDPSVHWAGLDLVVVRSCWDYVTRRAEFVAWASDVPRLVNPADVIAWNTDKRYLRDLASVGIPTVPTTWLEPDQPWAPPPDGEWVIKPAVSNAALDARSYLLSDPAQREFAVDHVRRLQAADRVVMAQPYQRAVDSHGETGLIYLGGAFSHAIRKEAVLHDPTTRGDRRFSESAYEVTARDATPAERELADRALCCVPGGAHRLVYGRVDLIPGPDGRPILSELELTEPSLFLSMKPCSTDRFSEAICSSLEAIAGSVPSWPTPQPRAGGAKCASS